MIFSFLLLFSYLSLYLYCANNKINVTFFNFLFIYNSLILISFILLNWINFLPTDTYSHYANYNKFDFNTHFIGDNLIYGLYFFLREYLNFSFHEINIISLPLKILSFLFIFKIIYQLQDKYLKIYLIVLFLLPSFSYFTVGINKDFLCFFLLNFFTYSVLKKKLFIPLFLATLIFFVRPYLFFLMLLSIIIFFSIKLIFLRKASILLLLIFIIFISFAGMFFLAKNYLGSFGHNFLEGNFLQIINNLQIHYSNTNLGIPEDTKLFTRLLNYIFYPIYFDINDFQPLFIIMIIENLFLAFLFIKIIFTYKKFYFSKESIFLILFFTILMFTLSMVTSNQGISFRQKWMSVPYFILLIAVIREKLYKFNFN